MTDTVDSSSAGPQGSGSSSDLFGSILSDFIAVLTKPVEFFQHMPKEGGFIPPLIFMVAMALVNAVLMAILGLVGLGAPGMMGMGFMGIIMFPIMAAIFGFVGATIVFVIWKLMGSGENFETAYRCTAYSYACAPIAAVLHLIPYLGTLVGVIWPMALMALASMHVHGRSQKLSWGVFGVIGLLLAFISFGAETAGRKMQDNASQWQQHMEKGIQQGGKEMTPEEAGKAMENFLKGLQESREK